MGTGSATTGRRVLAKRLLLLSSTWSAGLRPEPSRGALYDAYAPTYDVLDGGQAASRLGFDDLRRAAVGRARGDVLEVGVGTGLNLPNYQWSGVRSLVALDSSARMLDVARERVEQLGVADKVWLRTGDVAKLPFADASFDVVVDTFSLCVFEEPDAAMREMRRVLRPSGTLLCVEHQRAGGALGAYQDLSEPFVTPLSKGCVWNQDVRAIARRAELRIVASEEAVLGTVVSLVLQPT
jgi:ubiquinone/menaquinone biosynthesis C-methylase UbiE